MQVFCGKCYFPILLPPSYAGAAVLKKSMLYSARGGGFPLTPWGYPLTPLQTICSAMCLLTPEPALNQAQSEEKKGEGRLPKGRLGFSVGCHPPFLLPHCPLPPLPAPSAALLAPAAADCSGNRQGVLPPLAAASPKWPLTEHCWWPFCNSGSIFCCHFITACTGLSCLLL